MANYLERDLSEAISLSLVIFRNVYNNLLVITNWFQVHVHTDR